MTTLETILLYVGFGIVFLFFLVFVNGVLNDIAELLERRQNEKTKKEWVKKADQD